MPPQTVRPLTFHPQVGPLLGLANAGLEAATRAVEGLASYLAERGCWQRDLSRLLLRTRPGPAPPTHSGRRAQAPFPCTHATSDLDPDSRERERQRDATLFRGSSRALRGGRVTQSEIFKLWRHRFLPFPAFFQDPIHHHHQPPLPLVRCCLAVIWPRRCSVLNWDVLRRETHALSVVPPRDSGSSTTDRPILGRRVVRRVGREYGQRPLILAGGASAAAAVRAVDQ